MEALSEGQASLSGSVEDFEALLEAAPGRLPDRTGLPPPDGSAGGGKRGCRLRPSRTC
jgi:hypothetical protein